MTKWVNEFWITNRISMNAKKSILFGRDEKGKEMEGHIETITHVNPGEGGPGGEEKDGATFRRERVNPTHSGSKEIKYLGAHMNMDLNWEKQIAVMSSTIGMYMHLAIANNLSADQTTTLFNSYLRPKLEYRMQFAEIPAERLKAWDWQLTKTLSEKIEKGNYIKKEALSLVVGLRLPTEYYQTTQLTQVVKKLNDETDMGETTRTRMVWRKNRKYKHKNAAYTQMLRGNQEDLIVTENREYKTPIRKDTDTGTRWMKITVGGKTHSLPEDHDGIWGNEQEKITAKIFTDGSRHQRKGGSKAGWGGIILNDWMVRNWHQVHEREHEAYRWQSVDRNVPHWGGETKTGRIELYHRAGGNSKDDHDSSRGVGPGDSHRLGICDEQTGQ